MLVEAFKVTFDADYPEAAFRGLPVSLEYPIQPADYPGIWVGYEDTQPLQVVGIGHTEIEVEGTTVSRYRRWKFAGYATYTISALSSLERDRLYDEVVKVLAFGLGIPAARQFRQYVESNPLIAANFDFDQIETRGEAAMPGTPWGTDEIIYERTLNMEVIGEFVSDAETGLLVALSRIQIDEPDIYYGSQEPPAPEPPGALPTDWI